MSYDGWANFIGVFKAWHQNDIRMDEACICWTWWCKPLSCRTLQPDLHPHPHTCVFAPFVRTDFTHGLTKLGFFDPTWPTLQPRAFANSIAVWHKLGLIFWKFERHSNQVAAPNVWSVGNWTMAQLCSPSTVAPSVQFPTFQTFGAATWFEWRSNFQNMGPNLCHNAIEFAKARGRNLWQAG